MHRAIMRVGQGAVQAVSGLALSVDNFVENSYKKLFFILFNQILNQIFKVLFENYQSNQWIVYRSLVMARNHQGPACFLGSVEYSSAMPCQRAVFAG
jgi:hypothetical protein